MTGLGAAKMTRSALRGAQVDRHERINQTVTPAFDSDIVTCFQWLADPDGNPNTVDDVPDVIQNSWESTKVQPIAALHGLRLRWWAVIDNARRPGPS
jgi:hypothetical protein